MPHRLRARVAGIRYQLLLAFGLLAAAAASVILIEEHAQRRTLQVLESLSETSLARLSAARTISDAYSHSIGGLTFQVRNGLRSWDDGSRRVAAARARVAEAWDTIEALPADSEDRLLVEQALGARAGGDEAAAMLQRIFDSRDAAALADFADRVLFPSLQPVVIALNRISERELAGAERRLREQATTVRDARLVRISLSVLGLALALLLGRRILSNIYRGAESLSTLARGVQRGDFDRQPPYQPRGELGDVQQVLLEMRDSVRENEAVLAQQLAHNQHMLQRLRESEAVAVEANAAKSQFLATMSHEIRTPMIGVVGMLDVLSMTRLDAEQRRCVSVIEQSSQSLLQILGDILDFSKIEAGRLELHRTPADVAVLVQATVANFQGAASSKGLDLGCRIDPQLAPAHQVDALRLRQVLTNLVANAVKFTDSGSVEVLVHAGATAAGRQRIELEVVDTGIGVAPEQQPRLFESFSQIDAASVGRRAGTGLGLAICKRLVEAMGGSIRIDSRPGQGTRMCIDIEAEVAGRQGAGSVAVSAGSPRRRFHPRPLPDPEQAQAERSLILVVDDHPTNRQVIARQLAVAGFLSEPAIDGAQGLEQWRSGRFALVLTDVHMPGLDGYALAEAIRREEQAAALPRTPVIALTAVALKGEAERCLQAGMDDYLPKPVSIATLAERVLQWLPHLDAPDPGAESQVPGDSPLDRDAAAALGGGGLLEEMLAEFLDSCERDLDALLAARDAGDLERLHRGAHRLHGAAGLVGAGELAEAAAALEQATLDGDWSSILPGIAAVEAATEHLRIHLRVATGTPPAA